ncbi:MAG: hypothetical protein DLM62_02685, partial [Pseudonocardiales bacterium]
AAAVPLHRLRHGAHPREPSDAGCRESSIPTRAGAHTVIVMTQTSSEQTADLLHAVLADLATVVGGITPEQLHDPTPCAAFDVEQL